MWLLREVQTGQSSVKHCMQYNCSISVQCQAYNYQVCGKLTRLQDISEHLPGSELRLGAISAMFSCPVLLCCWVQWTGAQQVIRVLWCSTSCTHNKYYMLYRWLAFVAVAAQDAEWQENPLWKAGDAHLLHSHRNPGPTQLACAWWCSSKCRQYPDWQCSCNRLQAEHLNCPSVTWCSLQTRLVPAQQH